MSADEWRRTYHEAWAAFYTPEHVEALLRRALACGMRARKIMMLCLWFYYSATIESVHPLQAGLFRRKYRRDRRPGLPLESSFLFYPRYAREILSKAMRLLALADVRRDPPAGRSRSGGRSLPRSRAHAGDRGGDRRSGDLPRDGVGPAGGRQNQPERALRPVQAA